MKHMSRSLLQACALAVALMAPAVMATAQDFGALARIDAEATGVGWCWISRRSTGAG